MGASNLPYRDRPNIETGSHGNLPDQWQWEPAVVPDRDRPNIETGFHGNLLD